MDELRQQGLARLDEFVRQDVPDYQQCLVTAAPVSGGVLIGDVYADFRELAGGSSYWSLSMAGKDYPIQSSTDHCRIRPILRGIQLYSDKRYSSQLKQVFADGAVSSQFVFDVNPVDGTRQTTFPSIKTVIADLIEVLWLIDRFRQASGVHGLEWALNIEIQRPNGPELGMWTNDSGIVLSDTFAPPTYSVRDRRSWNDLVGQFYKDVQNAAHLATPEQLPVVEFTGRG